MNSNKDVISFCSVPRSVEEVSKQFSELRENGVLLDIIHNAFKKGALTTIDNKLWNGK